MDGPAVSTRRARIVYELTPAGKEHLQAELATSGPASWEDEQFDVRFAFFGQTDADTRLRILEGRRSRLTERLDTVRQSVDRARGRVDEYTLELQRHGLDLVEREVRWLDDLIDHERGTGRRAPGSPFPAVVTTTETGRPAGTGPTDARPDPQGDTPSADAGRTTQKERG